MATIPVKWFHYGMPGAPAFTGGPTAVGAVVTLLDAVLVDGWGTVTIDSLVVSGGVATVTRTAGIPFVEYQVIKVAGATPSGLNGEWRVDTIDLGAKQLTFSCPGISDGAASGSITIKVAPLNWERVYSGSNIRVYRSLNEDSPRSYLRVDDSSAAAYGASVKCYEAMTDIDTGTGNWWANGTMGLSRPNSNSWYFIGDDRTFYYGCAYRYASYQWSYTVQTFGDFVSFAPVDPRNDLIGLNNITTGSAIPHSNSVFSANIYYSCKACHWDYRQNTLGPTTLLGVSIGRKIFSGLANDNQQPVFPSPVDGGALVLDAHVRQWYNDGARGHSPIVGRLRGGYWVVSKTPYTTAFPFCAVVDNVIGLEGRKVAFVYDVNITGESSAHYEGRVAFDITGPWT